MRACGNVAFRAKHPKVITRFLRTCQLRRRRNWRGNETIHFDVHILLLLLLYRNFTEVFNIQRRQPLLDMTKFRTSRRYYAVYLSFCSGCLPSQNVSNSPWLIHWQQLSVASLSWGGCWFLIHFRTGNVSKALRSSNVSQSTGISLFFILRKEPKNFNTRMKKRTAKTNNKKLLPEVINL